MDELIEEANERLKAAGVAVRVHKKGDYLYLRAVLPPKQGSQKGQPHWQFIAATGFAPWVRANKVGLRRVEREAHSVYQALCNQSFDWVHYLKAEETKPEALPPTVTGGQWVERFRADYFKDKRETLQTLSTWRNNYYEVFRRLNQDGPLTAEVMERLALGTKTDSRSRKGYCEALNRLARFAGIELDLTPLKGDYSPESVVPRDLPTDETIYAHYEKIELPHWRWVYGMIATYGLRPHEVFHLELDEFIAGGEIVEVGKDTKTGRRYCWPLYPEWLDHFNLRDIRVPPIKMDRDNQALGGAVKQAFRQQYGLPFKPYDLRHCWARRASEFRIEVASAAYMMGHNVQVHMKTYHRWFGRGHYQLAYEALTQRADRPQPPTTERG